MAATHTSYSTLVRESINVAHRLGMWPLYAIRDAAELEHLIGYMVYRTMDLRRRAKRLKAQLGKNDDLAKALSDRAASWARAGRWMMRLRGIDHVAIARRMIADMDAHPEHSQIPYVAASEVTSRAVDDPVDKLDEIPPRSNGRPPAAKRVKSAKIQLCSACDGYGFVDGK